MTTTISNINESTTVKELEVNSTVYDIVGKGILDQNTKTTKTEWVGTKAEYDALGVYADHCTYIITDDSADSRVDEVGAIAEEVNTLKSYDYVVDWQIPTAENNYTWYRKYKSGWVEQGGAATIPGRSGGGSSEVIVNIPVTMANTTYQTNCSIYNGGVYWASWGIEINNRTTTTVKLYAYLNTTGDAAALPVFWEVKGIAA